MVGYWFYSIWPIHLLFQGKTQEDQPGVVAANDRGLFPACGGFDRLFRGEPDPSIYFACFPGTATVHSNTRTHRNHLYPDSGIFAYLDCIFSNLSTTNRNTIGDINRSASDSKFHPNLHINPSPKSDSRAYEYDLPHNPSDKHITP